MKFTTSREALLRPLALVTGVVERRQTLPVLSNLLINASADGLSLTGTDLEVELVARRGDGISIESEGQTTIPARKLADIWRSLPDDAEVSVTVDGDKAVVRSGRSRFTLATLPASDFPSVEQETGDVSIDVPLKDAQRLLKQTSFAMAQQDVRYFLNGLLLEITGEHIRAVATDGHRLAMCTLDGGAPGVDRIRAIVPRKGVLELSRLIADGDEPVTLIMGRNHLQASQGDYSLTTKLVDGQFPDYDNVIPQHTTQSLTGDRDSLRQAFHRAAILSNEKYRGIRLIIDTEQMMIRANNPEQEEAEEVVAVDYAGEPLEIGFNVSYLQDVLNVLGTSDVRLSLSDANSSALIEAPSEDDSLYVVMPMKL